MNEIYKFLTSYTQLMNNKSNICINFLSNERNIIFSLNVKKIHNTYYFKTMNAIQLRKSRFNKFIQNQTYIDSFNIKYYNIIIS